MARISLLLIFLSYLQTSMIVVYSDVILKYVSFKSSNENILKVLYVKWDEKYLSLDTTIEAMKPLSNIFVRNNNLI